MIGTYPALNKALKPKTPVGGYTMYRTCRHIKPNGLRCESPALRESYFCYFHSKLHGLGAEQYEKYGPMRLPTPEGPASIQLSIAKITDALINGRIDPKRAGQLLYAMQIASQNLESHRRSQVDRQVQSMTTTSQGEELAPDEYVCDDDDDCNQCPFATRDQCPDWKYASEIKPEDAPAGDNHNKDEVKGEDDGKPSQNARSADSPQ